MNSHQEPNRNSEPQTSELPVKPNSKIEGQRQRNKVVARQIGVPPNLLPPKAPQQAMGHGRDCVEQLHRRANRQRLGHDVDDLAVLREKQRYVVPEDSQERHVEQAN